MRPTTSLLTSHVRDSPTKIEVQPIVMPYETALRVLQPEGAGASQVKAIRNAGTSCVAWSQALLRPWHGGLKDLQSTDLFRVWVNALHSSGPQTLLLFLCSKTI